ncbi:MAG TPA: hypothetical protein DFR83_29130 [Deltaproteobacteria bacterium]|nr:hypothetical protein [Deltaproteobacteria bacterium]
MNVLFIAAAASLASAQPLKWNWNQAEPVTFHAEAFVNTPVGAHFKSAANVDARALAVGMATDISCVGTQGKKVHDVVCTIQEITLEGRAFKGEQEKLDAVLKSYDETMTGARIDMRVRADGHIQSLELAGIETDIAQSREALEHMRQLTRKIMAPLSIVMPKEGNTAKPWKHRGMPMFFELITTSGTTGGVALKYRVDGDGAGAGVFVVGEGRGNLGSQNQTAGATSAGALNMVGASQTRFDPDAGLPFYSEVSVTGESGASNINPATGVRYALAAWIGRTYADGSLEGLEGKKPAAK